jgi:hypothetical protein
MSHWHPRVLVFWDRGFLCSQAEYFRKREVKREHRWHRELGGWYFT